MLEGAFEVCFRNFPLILALVRHKHTHKKKEQFCFSCAYAHAYVERITSENCPRQISEFVLLMFRLMLMFMSRLFSFVHILMLVLVVML